MAIVQALPVMNVRSRLFQRQVAIQCIAYTVGEKPSPDACSPKKLLATITAYVHKLYDMADTSKYENVDYTLLLVSMKLICMSLSVERDIIRTHSNDAAVLRALLHSFNARVREVGGRNLIKTKLKDTLVAIAGDLALFDNEHSRIQTIEEFML